MIEAESRPYRYDIDKMLSIEGKSNVKSSYLESYRIQIENRMKEEITVWNREKGEKYKLESDYDNKLVAELEKIQPNIIQEVGSQALNKSKANYLFIPEELMFEISFYQFHPFKIEVPIDEIEDFKSNFSKVEFRKEVLLFSESDQFVFNEVEVYNPVSGASYLYKSSDSENMPPPTFTISLPEEEF